VGNCLRFLWPKGACTIFLYTLTWWHWSFCTASTIISVNLSSPNQWSAMQSLQTLTLVYNKNWIALPNITYQLSPKSRGLVIQYARFENPRQIQIMPFHFFCLKIIWLHHRLLAWIVLCAYKGFRWYAGPNNFYFSSEYKWLNDWVTLTRKYSSCEL